MLENDLFQHYDFGHIDREPRAGCWKMMVTAIIALVLCVIITMCLSSCTTSQETVSTADSHRVETFMQRMDSIMRSHSVFQQDSAWHQLVMRQFQSIREKSDTSHYVVTDTAGKVVKERIVINNVREVTSETERDERQVLIHRLEVMDSTLTAMHQQIHHLDSLVQQEKITEKKEVEKPLTQLQKAIICFIVFICMVLLASFFLPILKSRLTHSQKSDS